MSRRIALRKLDDFFLLNALGIARESAILYLKHTSLLGSIALLLFPASAAIMLSHALLDRLLIAKLALGIQAAFGYGTAGFNIPTHNQYYIHLFYRKLSETILSYVFCFPFLSTFSLWAGAAVAYTVSSTYAGNRPSWKRLIQQLPKIWKRLLRTYIWVCLLVLGFSALMFVLMSVIISGVSVLGLPAIWEIEVALSGGILYSIAFAHAMIVCNLATVVCVMEECCYGLDAVFRAMFLIRGRTQIALQLAVITNMSLVLVESLFEYRVMGIKHGGSFYYENGSSRISSSAVWEAPLLIFMYSMLGVMEGLMSCVFYYTCKSSRLELGTNSCLSSSSFLNSVEDEFCCTDKIKLSDCNV